MAENTQRVLMLSLHGYVGADVELGKPDTGGQVVFVLELARKFAEMGHAVDVVTRQFEGQPEIDDLGDGARIVRVPFGGDDFIRKEDMHDHLEEFVAAFLAGNGHGYDVVSSHYWDAGWAGQRIAEELAIPHVHTPHSLGAWKKADMKGDTQQIDSDYRFEERIRKEFLTYRQADMIIATSPQQVEQLEADYEVPERHVTMIPPGVDEDRYTPVSADEVAAARQRLEMREHDVYTIGRAAANKGYDLLIRAVSHLVELVPDVRLQLAVGADSTSDRRKVKKWTALSEELGVADRVVWRGYVPDEDMADLYRAAGVFALPSRYEPFGMTAIEAMACGTPTVVTVHGGLEEMTDFGTQALFADPHRPEEFAVMLSMPMQYERLRERLSVDGARYARRHFGWRSIARRTARVMRDVRG